uniref:Uncharacterized protein n=1 Tax=Arundo donax TaxID=35708 RepID=A0A0A8ZTK4_ARUDO
MTCNKICFRIAGWTKGLRSYSYVMFVNCLTVVLCLIEGLKMVLLQGPKISNDAR